MSTLEFYSIDTIYEHLKKAGCKKDKQDVIALLVGYFKRISTDPDFTTLMKILQRNDKSLDPTKSSLAIDNIALYMKNNINKSPIITHWNKFILQIKESVVTQQLKINTIEECKRALIKQHLQNDEYYEHISEKLLYAAVLTFILYSCFKQKEASFDSIVNVALPNIANPEISRNSARGLAENHVKGICSLLFNSYFDESYSSRLENAYPRHKKNIYTFTLLAIVYKNSCVESNKYNGKLNRYINVHSKKKDGCFKVFDSIQMRLTSQKEQIEQLVSVMPEFKANHMPAEELISQWANQSHYKRLYDNDKYFITGHLTPSDAHSLKKTYGNSSMAEFPIRKTDGIEQTSIMKAAKLFFSDGLRLLVAADKEDKRYKLKWETQTFKNPTFMYMHKVFVEEIYLQLNNRFLGEV